MKVGVSLIVALTMVGRWLKYLFQKMFSKENILTETTRTIEPHDLKPGVILELQNPYGHSFYAMKGIYLLDLDLQKREIGCNMEIGEKCMILETIDWMDRERSIWLKVLILGFDKMGWMRFNTIDGFVTVTWCGKSIFKLHPC